MSTRLLIPVALLLTAGTAGIRPAECGEFDSLKENQTIADFQTEAVYVNEAGKAMGARFRHVPTRYVLDVLRIQSIPQGFMWVNSPPPSDQGEPHTLEHLLLGKGTKGRYVASLEDMSLGRSSAFTQQRRTCYHFSAEAGTDVFFKLYEAKLDAMLNPNFSDEEIRREVCNVGVVEKKDGSGLWLEEKGTVYNEMVSTFERPWGNLFQEMGRMQFGKGHTLSRSSGGLPSAIREMTPADIRAFHASTHHLGNMGCVLSIGDEIPLDGCLERLSGILKRVEPGAEPMEDPADLWSRIDPPNPAPRGEIAVTHFPNQNESEPGIVVLGWPAEMDLEASDVYLMELFRKLMASGQTSNLYRKFIDSQTREMDIGANSVFSWLDNEPGYPLYIGFNAVDPASCNRESLEKIRSMVMDEIRSVTAMEAGSDALEKFNRRARNQILQDRRDVREFLNSPPRFGYRGTGTSWVDHLQHLHRKGGFRRNLAEVDDLNRAEALLDSGENFWAEAVARWGLLEDPPYAASATADPEMLTAEERAREERLTAHVARYKEEFGAASDQEALEDYADAYDSQTAIIDKEAATIQMPGFVENPPLGLDPHLKYEVDSLPGGGDLVTSVFDNITSGTVGMVFNLDVVPDDDLVYVPALPTLIRNVGVVKDGVAVPYDEFDELLRREILSLSAYFSVDLLTERVELTLEGAGSDQEETMKAVDWMRTALLSPDLRPENLSRIRDAVDSRLKSARNRTRGSEESWVDEPVYSYWKQKNRLVLLTDCFLTEAHALHRLRWLLKEGDSSGIREMGEKIAALAESGDREALDNELGTMIDAETTDPLVRDAAEDLRLSLSEIPDASLAGDLRYLVHQMSADLETDPAGVLAEINGLLGKIRARDNLRSFLVCNSNDRKALTPKIEAIVADLADGPSKRFSHSDEPLVAGRAMERGAVMKGAPFVALVNENTRSGVHYHMSDCASYSERNPEALLRFLSARLYGGGGAHSMFMKTWGAGLAYSNGLRSNESNGRLIYYAERCPDLAQTMQFVVGELENAPHDPSLADYAVAQAFGGRSGGRYEERGEAMAKDLARGVTPEVVAGFRKSILELRKDPGFYDKIQGLMKETYGEILPGYGPSGEESAERGNAIYYVIGPEKQIQSWETYLRTAEPNAVLTRIYPRDYWQVRAEPVN